MFGRKSRAEKLKARANESSLIPLATLATIYGVTQPVLERLLYDDDLRDNIRTFIESAQKVYGEVSGESPQKIVDRLWEDDKLRSQIETAASAAQQGRKRIQGQKVKDGRSSSGGSFRRVFFVISAIMAFLFINPKTGPQARRMAQDVINSVNS